MCETRFINCDYCQTEGRIYRGQYEDERDCGPCPVCNGECVVEVEVEPISLEDLEHAS